MAYSLKTIAGTDLEHTFEGLSFAKANVEECGRQGLLDLLREIRSALADPCVHRDSYYRIPVLNAESEVLRLLAERYPRLARGMKPHVGVANRRAAEEVVAPATAEQVKAAICRFEAAGKTQNVGGMEAAYRAIKAARMPLVVLALDSLGKDAKGIAWFFESAERRIEGANEARARRKSGKKGKQRKVRS